MKKNRIYIFGLLLVGSTLLVGCGTYTGGYSSGYRSIDHYHHGNMGWGSPYYHDGGPIIIVDDIPDIPDIPDFGAPEAVELPDIDW